MKILFLSDEFPPNSLGGSGIVAYNLAKELKKSGHEIYILTTIRNKTEEKNIEFEGLKVYQIYSNYHERWRAWLSLYNPQTVLKVKNIIKEIKPDVINNHNVHQHLSYHCLKIAKKYAKAVFLTAHDVMLVNYGKLMPRDGENIYKISIWDQIKQAKKRYNPFRNIIIRHYLKYVDKIFSASNALKRVLKTNGIKNIETIHNGIDVNDWKINPEKIKAFKEKYKLQNKKIVLFGGRLSNAKGGEQALKATALIKQEVKNFVLLVAGKKSKYLEEMKGFVKQLKIDKNIIFTGWLERKELIVAYHSADIIAFPSICFETFGMTNLEAMACKKPVVSTSFGGPSEVVISERTGYLIDSDNIELIAEKIIDLLKNSKLAKEFGEAGYKRAKNSFSLKNQIKKTLNWYNKFLN